MLSWVKKHKEAVLFYGVVLFVLLWRLGTNHLWASEDRWAEIAREMWITGDWFHPAINGVIYYDKPLLSYWPIAFLSIVFNTSNELLSRIPSAAAAIMTIWFTRDFARRVFNEKAMIYSGWLLISAYGFLFWSRMAAADILNVAVIIQAIDWFYREKDNAGFFSYFIFYLICCIGALAKGFPALIIPPVVVLSFVIIDGSWKKHLCLKNFIAVVPAVSIALIPYFLSAYLPMVEWYSQPNSGLSGLELIWRENVTRVFHPFDHNKEPWICYIWHVPRILLPWTLAFLGALTAAAADWKKTSNQTRWIWISSLLIFVLFSASGSRRWYYILPIIPFAAVGTSEWIARNGRWSNIILSFMKWIYIIIFSAVVFVMAVLFITLFIAGFGEMLVNFDIILSAAVSVFLCAASLWGILSFKNWESILFASVSIVFLVFCEYYTLQGTAKTEKQFALDLKKYMVSENIPCDRVIFFEKDAPKIIFYADVRKPFLLAQNEKELKSIIENIPSDQSVLVITENKPKVLSKIKVVVSDEIINNPVIIEKTSVLSQNALSVMKKFQCPEKIQKGIMKSEMKKKICLKISGKK